jgi:hypothetical protein
MVDVTRLPANAFGYVPTPALVAPIEFTLTLTDYAALGGHMAHVRPAALLHEHFGHLVGPDEANPWPLDRGHQAARKPGSEGSA